jgi:phage terminase large subunit-like protein
MRKSRKATLLPESENGTRDYVAIAIRYAEDAVSDRRGERFGKWARLAARRFLNDLKRARRRRGAPFRFDEWHACDPCRFIENLPHVEGTWDTPNIVLHPAHIFATVNIFGFRKHDGTRRFTTALFAVARKNAKSTWAAGVLLYCELCEGERGPQIVSAATTGAQARIVFGIAKRMVELTPDLRTAFGVEPFANAIACVSNGGTFKPINAKASTQDGLNPSAVGCDELHAHKSYDLLNVLKSASGARRNPLFLFTTTEGYETPGPWPEQRKFAHDVLEGLIDADHYFAIIYSIDEADDDFDEGAWRKANPLMDVNPVLAAEIAKEAVEARAMPGRAAEFRIKRLNRQSAAATAWVNLPKWRRCDGVVDIAALRGAPCYGGLDLASTTDLTAFRLTWRVDGEYFTRGWRWVPAEAVKQRTERGTARYDSWVERGLIKMTEGDVADYGVIEKDILETCEGLQIIGIGYDPWNATDIVNRLVQGGLPMIEFRQGPASYHPAMQELERAYLGGRLHHGGDPVLNWCAANMVPRYDENMNSAPSKKRSAEKIDDLCALLMSIGIGLTTQPDPPSVYETRGIVSIEI